MQIGGDFGFGSRLIFNPDQEITNNPDQEIEGSIEISQYTDTQKRERNILINKVKIQKCGDRTLSTPVKDDQIGDPVYKVTFSSDHAEKIIEALVGIERGLKPKYPGKNEIIGS